MIVSCFPLPLDCGKCGMQLKNTSHDAPCFVHRELLSKRLFPALSEISQFLGGDIHPPTVVDACDEREEKNVVHPLDFQNGMGMEPRIGIPVKSSPDALMHHSDPRESQRNQDTQEMEHIADTMKKTAHVAVHETSLRLPDGTIVEMVHDQGGRRTQFASFVGGQVSLHDDIVSGGIKTVPYSPRNNIIAHNIVLFPKSAALYGTELELIESVRAFIHRYVDLEPDFERIAAHYVLLSWIYDAFSELPYLRVRGDPGTGKTRFLTTIGSICYKPMLVSGASSVSPIFRMLDAFRGTLVIDESDFRFSDERAEFVKILNNGNGRGFPVLRCEQSAVTKEFNPRAYAVFGPKIIATRGPFEDRALESRCITHDTSSAGLRREIPLNLPSEFHEEALALRNMLLMFRFKNLTKDRDLAARRDPRLEPRLNQVFAPLLSVVDDPATLDALKCVMAGHQSGIIADRGLDVEGAILEVVRELALPGKPTPSVRTITELFLERHQKMYPRTTPKWVGHILRKKLGIATTKMHGSYVIATSGFDRLPELYEKYGVAAPDGERIATLFDVSQVPEVSQDESLQRNDF